MSYSKNQTGLAHDLDDILARTEPLTGTAWPALLDHGYHRHKMTISSRVHGPGQLRDARRPPAEYFVTLVQAIRETTLSETLGSILSKGVQSDAARK
ncbi:MAG: hypothetical protein ABSD76_18380 [Terriglobales bacterium]|jgi:hypothetical protein